MQHRCNIDAYDLDKETVELLLSNTKNARARRLLELRQLGAHAAVKKVEAFLSRRGIDGRVRGEFQFHAAGTGRWSSRGVQVHNLKRLPDDFDHAAAIKVISTGNYKLTVETFPQPLKVIGTLMRPMIIATKDHELWGADFSGIEARITAWLADQKDKLEIFRQYDAGKGPDPYIVTASKIMKKPIDQITKQDRQIYGKPPELAFGFQGGVNAFRKFATEDFTDEEIIVFRDTWREAHSRIRSYWYDLYHCFWSAIHKPNFSHTAMRRTEIIYDPDSFCLPIIWMILPSGRKLVYPDARVRRAMRFEQKNGDITETSRGVYFKDNTQGQWRDVRMYGGLACENVTQAVARDLLAEALTRLDVAKFKIVGHVHDEIFCEEPKSSKRFEQFTKLMNVIPAWAEGLPVVAKSWRADRYVK